MGLLAWLQLFASWTIMTTSVASIVCSYGRRMGYTKVAEVACEWFQETFPLWVPLCIYMVTSEMMTDRSAWTVGIYMFNAIFYGIFKGAHDDHKDDRWKKRRKKVAEKIKALASGKLVAVPARG